MVNRRAPPLLFPRFSATGDGNAGGQTLVPLDEPHAGELVPQPGNCIQNPARLETDLAGQRLWHPDDHLADGLFGE